MSRLVKKVFMSCQHEHNLNLGDIYLQRSCVVKLEKKKKRSTYVVPTRNMIFCDELEMSLKLSIRHKKPLATRKKLLHNMYVDEY